MNEAPINTGHYEDLQSAPRFPLHLAASIKADGSSYVAETENISANGVLFHHETPLSRVMLDLRRAEGDLVVGANEPYAITDDSDYTVPVHGEGRGLDHVEIEIRQDLLGGGPGQAAWAIRLARPLPIAAARL